MRRSRRLKLAARLAGSPSAADVADAIEALYATDEQSITGYWPWLRRHVTRDEFATRFATTDRSMPALFGLMMDLFAERGRTGLAPRIIGEKQIIGEKSPEHLRDVPQLADWFPTSVFIHTLRDPRAIFASELRRRREGRWGPKSSRGLLPEGVLDRALMPLQLVHTSLAWRRAVALDSVYRRTLGSRYLLVPYEELVREPTDVLTRICDLIEIAFDPAMLEIDTIGSSFADRRHAGIGLDPAAIDRWREHVGRLPRVWFRLALGREMARRGYR